MGADGETNGRVTVRELYDQLEKRDERINRRLDDIMDRLEPLGEIKTRVGRNEAEIETIRKRSNIFDGLNALGIAIGTALGILVQK